MTGGQGQSEARKTTRLHTPLNSLRTVRGWSRRELAERSQLSYPYICQLENGDREPSLDTLRKLAATFEVSIDELLAPHHPRPQHQPPAAKDNRNRQAPTHAHSRPLPGTPPHHQPATTSPEEPDHRDHIVDAAYSLLAQLPPHRRLDAAGALLARCIADQSATT